MKVEHRSGRRSTATGMSSNRHANLVRCGLDHISEHVVPQSEPISSLAQRQHWMGVLARAGVEALEDGFAALAPPPVYRMLRPAETGLVMMRGRAGGDGAPFNLGELTVTRCVVKPADGPLGFGYVAGRDHRHAELAAVFDALLQQPSRRATILEAVVDRLAADQARRRARRWSEAAATKVDFFTVVRGEG